MTFKRDLICPRVASWNAIIERLAMVQLPQGIGEFRCNLNKNSKFSVDSLYRALIKPVILVHNNKKKWKMKIPLKIKKKCVVCS